MKYKLIKEYPGSPNLGFITTPKSDDAYYVNSNWITPENYPEFWEELIEKDYEILSLIGTTQKIPLRILNKDTGLFKHATVNQANELELNYLLKTGYVIYSVKRLSDGKIFTIGDKLTDNFIIREFEIKNDNLLTWFQKESFSSYIKPIQGKSGNSQFNYINSLEKTKQPLFTTEDGVDIFEGDTVYFIDKKFYLSTFKSIIKGENILNQKNIRFSTKEKAEEYILLNKPCLSINDVAKVFVSTNYTTNKGNLYPQGQKLRDLVKQKLITNK